MKNTTSNIRSCLSTDVFTKAEAIVWCSAFSLISVLIVTVNLLTIVLFVIYKKVRKNFFFLVLSMACADLLIGAVLLKYRTLSGRPYVVVIISAWTLVLFSSAILSVLRVFVSKVAYFSFCVTYTFTLTFIICACTFGIWKTFQ